MPYWLLGCWFFGIAMTLGWITGPATESIMGAVPEEKSGVASAMNDVTRQVAGALGTAVVGSIITTLYASRVGDAVAGLPEEAASPPRTPSAGERGGATLPAAEGAGCRPRRRLHRGARARLPGDRRARGRRGRGQALAAGRAPLPAPAIVALPQGGEPLGQAA